MKLRFERGAPADLEEIFAFVAKDKSGQRPNSSHGSNRPQRVAECQNRGAYPVRVACSAYTSGTSGWLAAARMLRRLP